MTATSSYLNKPTRTENRARIDRLGIFINVYEDRAGAPTHEGCSIGYDAALTDLAEAVDGGWATRQGLVYTHTICDKAGQLTSIDLTDALAQHKRDEAGDYQETAELRRAYNAGRL